MAQFFDSISRWYFDVVYKTIRYRSLFFAIIFGFFAIVSLQYLQQISQPITRGYSESTVDGIRIRMWTPDKIYIGEENKDKIDFDISYNGTTIQSPDTDVSVTWDVSRDEGLAFTKSPLNFKLNTPESDQKSTGFYYRRTATSNPTAEITANVKIGANTTTISRTLSITKAPKETFAFLSSIIAGALTILSLIDQLRKLFTRKDK